METQTAALETAAALEAAMHTAGMLPLLVVALGALAVIAWGIVGAIQTKRQERAASESARRLDRALDRLRNPNRY